MATHGPHFKFFFQECHFVEFLGRWGFESILGSPEATTYAWNTIISVICWSAKINDFEPILELNETLYGHSYDHISSGIWLLWRLQKRLKCSSFNLGNHSTTSCEDFQLYGDFHHGPVMMKLPYFDLSYGLDFASRITMANSKRSVNSPMSLDRL